jgi:hypothetical protein
MIHGIVEASCKKIDAIWTPANGRYITGDDTAKAFPAAPRTSIPPSVVHGIVGASGKIVDAVWGPGNRRNVGGDNSTQGFPIKMWHWFLFLLIK